jgi:hypothetical protein
MGHTSVSGTRSPIVVIANSSSRMSYTLAAPQALPLILSILYPSSPTISYLITTTQPSLLANRLLDPPCSRPQHHDPEFNPPPPLPFRRPLPNAQFPTRMYGRHARGPSATPLIHLSWNVRPKCCDAGRVVQQRMWRPPQISAAADANDDEEAPLTLALSFSSSACSGPSSCLACTVLVSGTCEY